MSAKKVSIENVPKNVLGDIQALTALSKKDYIAIGPSIYEIEPAPAIVLMEAMGMFTELLEDLRKKKLELIKSVNPKIEAGDIQVYIRDLIHSTDAGPSLSIVLSKLLQGAETIDLEQMNIGQMISAIDKAIRINLDTLPESFRDTFSTPQMPVDDSNLNTGTETSKNH